MTRNDKATGADTASLSKPRLSVNQADPFGLLAADLARWQAHFGVTADQVRHDYVISRVLEALAPHSDSFVFYGGTALSRTILNGLRLSEDIDLLSAISRSDAARIIDEALRFGLRERFGTVIATPNLTQTRKDTDACVYHIGPVDIQIQLINGAFYTPWPTQASTVAQRYADIPDIELTTYTPSAFVAAKTTAWGGRNAPRDLYDLWALSQRHFINSQAAAVFKSKGPTGGYPHRWSLPAKPPTEQAWQDALDHQCVGKSQLLRRIELSWKPGKRSSRHKAQSSEDPHSQSLLHEPLNLQRPQ